MFKLPGSPSTRATQPELADFAELLCLGRGSASKSEILTHLVQVDDNEYNEGIDDDEDRCSNQLDEVMNEIDRRREACGKRSYPFSQSQAGTVIKRLGGTRPAQSSIYEYLLLCTRLNMKESRVHAGIDGTTLLERLSAEVLKNYLGPSRAVAHVFGTAEEKGFEEKVKGLCRAIGEGDGFKNPDPGVVRRRDGALDSVAWKPFSDGRVGKLVLFAQCKTGTDWKDGLSQLQPPAFIKTWMKSPFPVEPVRVFCVSEACDGARWTSDSNFGGIIFDRCRLVDYSDQLPADLVKQIERWSAAAKKTLPYYKRAKRRLPHAAGN